MRRPSLLGSLRAAHLRLSLSAVLAAGLILSLVAFLTLRTTVDQNLTLVARSISYSAEAATVFGDATAAQEVLTPIAAREGLQAARIVDRHGRSVASFEARMQAALCNGVPHILCGDVNIAHRPIDLRNWRANQHHPGFTPEERGWMDRMIEKVGYVDAFRAVNSEPDQYTWWSNRGRAWAKNVGWRIDYQLVTPGLKDRVRGASIYKRRRFSDHAPLTIDYDWQL